MPARGDRRPVTIPAGDDDANEKKLDEGAPSWGLGLRGDIRRGFAGLQRDIRLAIVALIAVPLVAMGLMAALVGGQLNFQGLGIGIQTSKASAAAPAAIDQPVPTP